MTTHGLRATIAVLSLVGAGIASYLVYARYSGVALACSTGGCETVQNSRYATLAGIPVALLGVVGYAALVASAARPGETAAAVGVSLAAAGVAFSGYLLYAQIALIDAICQWCLASDLALSLIALAAVLRFHREHRAAAALPDQTATYL